MEEKEETITQKIRITPLEKQIIEALEYSDFANESEPGLYGYIFHEEWNMNSFRGVMSSLAKKQIISWAQPEYVNDNPNMGITWGCIDTKYTIIEDRAAFMNWDLFEVV
jgi:hypothetical protein